MAKYLVVRINIFRVVAIIIITTLILVVVTFININNPMNNKFYDVIQQNYRINNTYTIIQTVTESDIEYVEVDKLCNKLQLNYTESNKSIKIINQNGLRSISFKKNNLITFDNEMYVPLKSTLYTFSLNIKKDKHNNIYIIE